MGDHEQVFTTTVNRANSSNALADLQPGKTPLNLPVTAAPCSHSIIHEEMQCTVVADLTKDWRFKNNAALHAQLNGAKVGYNRSS